MPDSVKTNIVDGTDDMIAEVRRDKYMLPTEKSWDLHTLPRLARAVFPDTSDDYRILLDGLQRRIISPAGRPMAGLGTDKNVTAINCFVMGVLEDSMRSDTGVGIMDSLAQSAFTMQMGGGIGVDFSPLRPKGARVARIDADASGPLTFMDLWDAMCRTIMGAGYRRGAMMATLRCDHPDVWNERHTEINPKDGKLIEPSFITAKREGSRLRMFNMSVLITDAFMRAIENDGMWNLGFHVPPLDRSRIISVEHVEGRAPWYIYRQVPARRMWDDLMRNTYVHAEPGVIFIDRVNRLSNLSYCEDITCCNPCGEQFLPPYGDCNLSHVNLAMLILDMFDALARWNIETLQSAVRVLVRMLNRVIDISRYPLPEQKLEAEAKRRIGLGITGLGNALEFLQLRYGSARAIEETGRVMNVIANTAYMESAMLAKEHGSFPAYDREKFLKAPFPSKLDPDVQDAIAEYGIRNGMSLTIAPTGTNSIAQGDNCSGGIEPVFDHDYERSVLQPDGSYKTFRISDYGYRKFREKFGPDAALPDYMVTATQITPREHVQMVAAAQKWVDNSISKTVNCPTDITFDDFKSVYDSAYALGCKCCSTYRPDPTSGRGSILRQISTEAEATAQAAPGHHIMINVPNRPDVLNGRTYKLKWPHLEEAVYLTVNDMDTDAGLAPFEAFLSTKAIRHQEWMTIFTRLISAVFRRGGDVTFLVDEMRQVQSADGGAFIGQKHYPSLVALIGDTLLDHFIGIGLIDAGKQDAANVLDFCPKCNERAYVRKEGCGECLVCHYTNCG